MTVCPRCGTTVDLADDDVMCSVYGVVTAHRGCPATVPAAPDIDIAPAA